MVNSDKTISLVAPCKLIGITGGIAAGKSTVAHYLRKKGYPVIDADHLGHCILEQKHSGYQQVVATFGTQILRTNGSIDRKILGEIVFADKTERIKLNSIIHPLIAQMITQSIHELQEHSPSQIIFLEAALLIESRWLTMNHQIWLVYASEEIAIQRLKRRNHLTQVQANLRLRAQLTHEERKPYADLILHNEGIMAHLFQQVEYALERLLTFADLQTDQEIHFSKNRII